MVVVEKSLAATRQHRRAKNDLAESPPSYADEQRRILISEKQQAQNSTYKLATWPEMDVFSRRFPARVGGILWLL
jgi:hypothetical protein